MEKWSENLSIGLPGMDEEHRRFFALIDDLDAAIAAHARPHDIERRLQVVVQEARAHFDHENRKLAELGLPHAERHIAGMLAWARSSGSRCVFPIPASPRRTGRRRAW